MVFVIPSFIIPSFTFLIRVFVEGGSQSAKEQVYVDYMLELAYNYFAFECMSLMGFTAGRIESCCYIRVMSRRTRVVDREMSVMSRRTRVVDREMSVMSRGTREGSCEMSGMSCETSGVSCEMSVMSRETSGVSCEMSVMSRETSEVSCEMSGMSRGMSGVSCGMSGVSCGMSRGWRILSRIKKSRGNRRGAPAFGSKANASSLGVIVSF